MKKAHATKITIMKIRTLIVLSLIGISQISYSQKSTFIGFEGAITSDIYEIIDPCNIIQNTPLITNSWGFTIGREIDKNFLVETGIIRKYYAEGYAFTKYPDVGSTSNAYNSWQIPVRLKAKLNLVNNKFFLTTTIGYHLGINTEYGYGGGSGGFGHINGQDTIPNSSYTINDSIAKTFSLLEPGIGLEVIAFKGFHIYLSSSYYIGMNNVYQLDLKVEDEVCSTENAVALSKGTYWNIAFGIKYTISNL
jgi:hypothetical protein